MMATAPGNRLWFVLVAALAAAPGARADEVSLVASANRDEVALNEQLVLTISISAPDPDRVKDLKLPDTGSLQVVDTREESSLSFSFSTGGGQSYSKIRNVVLVLQPTRTGKVVIGAASVIYKGRLLTTKPISVRVVPERPRPKQRAPRRSPFGWPSPLADDDFFRSPIDDLLQRRQARISEDDVFVRATVSPEKVVAGQQVTVDVAVYSRVGARIAAIRWPKLDGFYSLKRDTSKLQTQRKVVDGEIYLHKVIDRQALFPLQPGEIAIAPVEVDVVLSSSPFFAEELRTLRTAPREIQVAALPAAGRPPGFSRSNVGSFRFESAVDATEVGLNQPITYTLRIQGAGNIQRVRLPELPDLPRFKRFDPTVEVKVEEGGREVKGHKSCEYILVPLAAGDLTIPELEFSYYDDRAGEYRTERAAAVTIKVAASSAPGVAVGPGAGREVNILAGAFKPIRYQSSLSGYGPPFYRHPAFVPLLGVPPALYLMVLLVTFVRARVAQDNRRSRMRRAWTRGRRRLKQARRLAPSGQAADFYAELKAALLDGVEARIGLAPQGVTLEELCAHMQQAGISAAVAEAVVAETENCDFGRFAPSTSRGDQMQGAYERVRKLFKTIGKERPWFPGEAR